MGTADDKKARMLALAAFLARHASDVSFERRGRDKKTDEVRFAVSFAVPLRTLKKIQEDEPDWWQRHNGFITMPPDLHGANAILEAVGRDAPPDAVEGIAKLALDRKSTGQSVRLPTVDDIVEQADGVGPKPLRRRRKKMAADARDAELKEAAADLDLGEFSV